MNAPASFAYRQNYALPHGFSVEFTLDGLRLECAWSPGIPKGKRARQLLPNYRQARDSFLASLSDGAAIAVIEL